ncbi:MAG: VOC family protein [Chloroflexia bacterium]|nr:VOC family protein [Chloroflexia bacterium]
MSKIVRLQHASIPMPSGGNDRAREFYGSRLGLKEKSVPASLDQAKIIWFELGSDGDELHLFTEDGEGPSPGQHVCIQVDDIGAWRELLSGKSIAIEETEAIVNRPRFFTQDPFGNRLEITQVLGDYNDPPVHSTVL